MTITTKFDGGQEVFVIDNNEVKKMPIVSIETRNKDVSYTLLKQKAFSMMDKDVTIVRDEENCFSTIDQLADFYKVETNSK